LKRVEGNLRITPFLINYEKTIRLYKIAYYPHNKVGYRLVKKWLI
jgi:hypothetical protein